MTRDFEQIQFISDAAIGKIGDELTFPFPEVLKVIDLCRMNEIAVLGVEVFLVKPDGFYACGCSDYDLYLNRKWSKVQASDWGEYVRENNELAERDVRRNPVGDDHVYVLTTVSWKEFRKIEEFRRRMSQPS